MLLLKVKLLCVILFLTMRFLAAEEMIGKLSIVKFYDKKTGWTVVTKPLQVQGLSELKRAKNDSIFDCYSGMRIKGEDEISNKRHNYINGVIFDRENMDFPFSLKEKATCQIKKAGILEAISGILKFTTTKRLRVNGWIIETSGTLFSIAVDGPTFAIIVAEGTVIAESATGQYHVVRAGEWGLSRGSNSFSKGGISRQIEETVVADMWRWHAVQAPFRKRTERKRKLHRLEQVVNIHTGAGTSDARQPGIEWFDPPIEGTGDVNIIITPP